RRRHRRTQSNFHREDWERAPPHRHGRYLEPSTVPADHRRFWVPPPNVRDKSETDRPSKPGNCITFSYKGIPPKQSKDERGVRFVRPPRPAEYGLAICLLTSAG